MRKLLRNMARAKMTKEGYSKVNKRMAANWRKLTDAYPVNVVTGKKMSPNYKGRKRGKFRWKDLFCYSMKEA